MAFLKIFFGACLTFAFIVVSLTAGVIWGPLGPIIAEPLIRNYGENLTPALRVGMVSGSLHSGITLNDVSLTSDDNVLLDVARLKIRPSWNELWQGVLWLSDLEIEGVRANAEDLSALASHFGDGNGGNGEEPDSPITIRPLRVMLRDIIFDTPMYQFEINEGLLVHDGYLTLSANWGELPIYASGSLDFNPLQVLSLDVLIGSGRVSLAGNLIEPLNVKGELYSIKLDELLAVLPGVSAISGHGNIGGSFNVTDAGEHLEAWGSIGLKDGSVAGLPIEVSTSWSYTGDGHFLADTRAEIMSADVEVRVSADLNPLPTADRFKARGLARGLSMTNLAHILPLDVSLEGDNGMVDFWASADHTGKTAGRVFVRLPELKVDDRQIISGLRASVDLSPDRYVSVDYTGEVFGAAISGIGSVILPQGDAEWSPAMTFTASGINSSLVAAAFPALAPVEPSGLLDLRVQLQGQNPGQSSPFSAEFEAQSSALSLAGVRLDEFSVSARYENGLVTLDELKAMIGDAPLDFAGTLNLATSALRFDGGVKRLDMNSIPALTDSVMTGFCDISIIARGAIDSPEITVTVTGNDSTVMNIPLESFVFSCTYANDVITISETVLYVPGGSLMLHGSVAVPVGSEPILDVSSSLTNFDISAYSQLLGVEMAGRVNAAVKLSGPVSSAVVSGVLTSDALTVLSSNIRDLELDFSATAEGAEINRMKANIDNGSVYGSGSVAFTQGGRIEVDMEVDDLDIRNLLAQFGIDAGVGGNLDGKLSLRGSPDRPELTLEVTSPLTIQETLVDSLLVTVVSPAGNKFDIGALARMGDFDLALNASAERDNDGWSYVIESSTIDLNNLVSAKTPSMEGQISGSAQFRADGHLRDGDEGVVLNAEISVPAVSFAGIKAEEISIPIHMANGRVAIHQASGMAYGGKITINADVDLSRSQWVMNANVSGLDIGEAARPFLPEGEIVGSVDINVRARGDYGALMIVFANGDFRTSEGYLHKFDVLERITEDGRVSFREVRGSFFWDGNDLWLNPGTQATAQRGDILYRSLSVNGPMGLGGGGLGLNFNGRFNVEALDTVLSGMRGLFELTSGSLTGGRQLVRRAIGRYLGIADRDFQEVSFQLRGSWSELQLLNLMIDMPLENFVPVRASDSPAERRARERDRIQFNLRIPTGRGTGGEDEDARDQFRRQLLDNLLNWPFDSELW